MLDALGGKEDAWGKGVRKNGDGTVTVTEQKRYLHWKYFF
jgi:hypothetical protein